MSLRAASLFSNCGAGDVGYKAAGFTFMVLAELLEYRLKVAKLNHPRAHAVAGDLRETLPKVVEAWRSANGSTAPALLAACPPCQGMSSARSGRGRMSDATAGSRDPRNLLVHVIADAVEELAPRAVVVENVPAFLTRQVLDPRSEDAISAALLLVDRLKASYMPYPLVTDLADYGVPQTRKRAFITFLRSNEPGVELLGRLGAVPYPAPTHHGRPITLGEALADWALPRLDATEPAAAVDEQRPLHTVPVWDATRYAMVKAIPPGSGGTAWANSTCGSCGVTVVDPDAATCPSCSAVLPRPHVVDIGGVVRLISGFRRSSYARMDAAQPAATVTTASGRMSSDNTLHPTEDRVLSPLECQLLQTIPSDFRWGEVGEDNSHARIREMIGEAVPPHFTRQHGRVLAALLGGRRPYRIMAADDERVSKATRLIARARQSALNSEGETASPVSNR